MELSNSNTKKFLIFQETEILKKFLQFLKRSFSDISGNGNHGKLFLYFRKRNSLIFQKRETLKKFFISQEVTLQAQKVKKVTLRAQKVEKL